MPLREGGRIEVDYVDIIYITGDVNSSSQGGNVSIIPGGIICYTPPSGFTGNDDFDYIICDPSGLCDKGKVVINVTPPTNTPPTLFPDVAQACTNQAEIINVVGNDTDSDGNIDPTSVSIFSTPSNGTAVSNGDGTVTYTYTSNMAFTGLDTFQYQVCDDGTPLPVECSITSVVVNVSSLNTDPIALSDTASTILNQVFYINVLENDSDAEGNNLTVTINAAPANGLAVVLGNGLIEYTPNPDYTALDSFTYNVCDDGCPTQCTNGVLVLIDVENQPPVAIDDYEETGMNTSIDLCVLDNDIEPDGNTILLFSMGQDASDNMTLQGGVLSKNNNATPIDSSDDKVFYTPPMGYTGLDTFYYRICDDVNPGACDTAQVIINITPPIDLEVEKTVNAGIPVIGNNYTFKIKVTNNSATVGTGIFIRDNLPNELTYVSDDGGGFYDSNSGIWNVGTLNSGVSDSLEITATLNTYFANNIAEVSAADQFDIDSSPDNDDGDQSEDDESAASLQINLPPVADNDTTMTTEDTPVVINVLFDDSDPDGLLVGDSVRILTSPTMGVAIDNGDSTVTYTLSPNTFGIDSFEYEICDVGIPSLCDTAWVFITINPVNDPPIAVNDTTITDEGIPVAVNVLLNDSDPDGDLIGDSIRVLVEPMNGDTSMVGDSLLTYTPAVNFAGIDSQQYEVCDTSALGSLCDTAWVFISVYPGRDTIIVPPGDTCLDAMTYELPEVERTVRCDMNADIQINNFMDTDSCLTLVSNNPINGALDTVCVVLCDTIGGIEFCDTTVIIVETPLNLPPIADDEDVNTLEETAVIIPITVGDIDPDGMLDSLSIALVDSTSNGEALGALSLSISGGSQENMIEWSDGSSDASRDDLEMGTYAVTITDSNGCIASSSITLEETGVCNSIIEGIAWEDLNRNGIRDLEDSPLSNFLIMIYTAGDDFIDSMRTSENGMYSFMNLPAGDYYLRTEIPSEYRITQDLTNGDNAFNNSTSTTGILTVETGGTLNAGLGLYRLGKISGQVWSDSDKDGILDDEESGLSEIQVMLLDEDQELLASTFSDFEGYYSFTNLPPGSYYVEFNKPESLNSSPEGQGEDPARQSYASAETQRTDVIVVNSGDCYEFVNAGFYGLFDLELLLSASTETPEANSLVAFSIMIQNKGDLDAENVSVKTTFGDGLVNPIAISNNGVIDGNMITWTGLNIPAGGEIFVAYRVEAMAYSPDKSYLTQAEITSAEIEDSDSTPGNADQGLNEDDEGSVVTAPVPLTSADLSLTMSSSSQVVTPGSTIEYILTLRNDGPDAGLGIEVTNYLGAGFVENIAEITQGGTLTENEIIWSIDEMESGEEIVMSFTADVINNIDREDVRNAAEVTMASQFDPNSSPGNMGDIPVENDEALHIASVNKTADLELEIIDHENLYEIGETVSFDIILVNKGLDDAAMVKVVNYVPVGIINVSSISNGGVLIGNEIH
jgi:uncharacterized repeat protein (TIGR01451 family)